MNPTKLKHRRQAYILGLAALLLVGSAPVKPGSAALYVIGIHERDYQSNFVATDSAWFYKNTDGTAQSPPVGDGYYNAVEFKGGRSFQIPSVVYVNGADIVIDVTFANSGFQAMDVTVTVNDARLAIPPYPGTETWTYVALTDDGPYELSIPGAGGTDQTTMTFSSLPEYVCRGTLQVDMVATKNGNTVWSTGGWESWEFVYVTLGSPENYMQIPWTDVLDYACAWAGGADDEYECATGTTYGLYYSQLFAYNLGTPGVPPQWFESGKYKLALRLASGGYEDGNCQDVATFNAICLDALGAGVIQKRLTQNNLFVTNPVCPIGSDSSDEGNYELVPFSLHQQVHLSGYVYDAALAFLVDLEGDAHMNPSGPYWPLSGTLSYWQTPPPSSTPEYGLVRRYFNPTYDEITYDPWGWTLDPNLPHEIVSYTPSTFTYSGVK